MSFAIKLPVLSVCVLFAASLTAKEYIIEAPDGVGDVVALTNAINEINSGNNTGTRLLLKPGVYDLSGIKSKVSDNVHLYFNTYCRNGLIAGLGEKPGDVLLKGGGESDKKTVLYIWATDPAKPTVVSNLTITGGYRSGDGGGIYGSNNGGLVLKYVNVTNNYATGLGAGVLRAKMYHCLIADNTSSGKNGGGFWSDTAGIGAVDCVFTNNTTTKDGGGFYSTGSGGFLINCKFYGNSGDNGSGAYMSGNGFITNCLFKGNGPKIAVNSDKLGGGLYLNNGECVDCDFVGNHADSGGGVYVNSRTSVVRDCLFEGNRQAGWASGAAIFVNASSPLALVSNCVFNANTAQESSRTIISNAELIDCIITNHVVKGYLLAGCNMNRCYVAYNASSENGQNLDIATAYNTASVCRTNVNCIFVHNCVTNGANAITEGKTVLNCSYCGNYAASPSSGGIVRNGTAYNTILIGNRIGTSALDVRGNRYMTNCVFSSSNVAVDSDGYHNCKIAPNFKFAATADGGEYDIRKTSPAFNAGVIEEWMLPILGGCDFAKRPRIKYDKIDVGALECQFAPPFAVILR